MRRQFFLLLIFGLISTSCSQLYTGRTYLSEMEHDDSHYFKPEHDFPVVAGDTGEFAISESDRAARTPASKDMLESSRFKSSLKNELRELEEAQSEESQNLYQQYKKKFSNSSEKIYYLKLPPSERRDYLESRGFIEPARNVAGHSELVRFGSKRSSVALGMSKNDVLDNLGRPTRVEVAGNPSYENERWAYRYNGATKFIYFESGQVQGWE